MSENKRKMTPREEFEFYEDPQNLAPQGEAVRRPTKLTETLPIRVSPEMLEEAKRAAEADHRSVSSFVRVAVANELERRRASGGRSAAEG